MQGLADGYFVIPYTVGDYLSRQMGEKLDTENPLFAAAEAEVASRVGKLLAVRGKRSVDSIHRELGKIMWEHCGMARNAAGLKEALQKIPALRQEFRENVNVLGTGGSLNQSLEKAGRVADFLELGELLCKDALEREESCGGHFREESQTAEGEAKRDDERFSYVAAWQSLGTDRGWALHKEPLSFDYVHLAQRSYK